MQVTVDVDGVYSEKRVRLSCPYYGPPVSNGKVWASIRLSVVLSASFPCVRAYVYDC